MAVRAGRAGPGAARNGGLRLAAGRLAMRMLGGRRGGMTGVP